MRLSEVVDEVFVSKLRRALAQGAFQEIAFEEAMKFLLSDGILPVSGKPLVSYLALEAFAREQMPSRCEVDGRHRP